MPDNDTDVQLADIRGRIAALEAQRIDDAFVALQLAATAVKTLADSAQQRIDIAVMLTKYDGLVWPLRIGVGAVVTYVVVEVVRRLWE